MRIRRRGRSALLALLTQGLLELGAAAVLAFLFRGQFHGDSSIFAGRVMVQSPPRGRKSGSLDQPFHQNGGITAGSQVEMQQQLAATGILIVVLDRR